MSGAPTDCSASCWSSCLPQRPGKSCGKDLAADAALGSNDLCPLGGCDECGNSWWKMAHSAVWRGLFPHFSLLVFPLVYREGMAGM